MVLALLGAISGVTFAACSLLILAFAFKRSTGTGVMVLLTPGYILYFAFSQFEHRHKPLVVSTWLAALGLSAFFGALVLGAPAPV
jgi:hypothetical protein